MTTMKKEIIMGIPVHPLTYEIIKCDLTDYLKNNKKMIVTSLNPQIIFNAKKFPEIIQYIEQSTHCIADGIGIVLFSKLTFGNIKKRITGIDVMTIFLEYGNNNKKKVFFYGAKKDILTTMMNKFNSEYPNLKIVGSIDGYTNVSDEEVVDKINKVEPDFLFVAMGFPRQESFLAKNISQINAKVFQNVGGSFDIFSGNIKRAPHFYIRYNLEWLYRIFREPKRIFKIHHLFLFLIQSFIWKFKN